MGFTIGENHRKQQSPTKQPHNHNPPSPKKTQYQSRRCNNIRRRSTRKYNYKERTTKTNL